MRMNKAEKTLIMKMISALGSGANRIAEESEMAIDDPQAEYMGKLQNEAREMFGKEWLYPGYQTWEF